MKRLLSTVTASLLLVLASHAQVRANSIDVTPPSISFGNVVIGDTVQSNTVHGQVTLDPTWFVVSWQFTPVNLLGPGPLVLNGGGAGCDTQCDFNLTWSPTTLGSIAGEIIVS